MGMDLVELAMELEERFAIAITDEEGIFLIDTPKRIVWLVSEKLAGRNPAIPDFAAVTKQVLQALKAMPDYKRRWFWTGKLENMIPVIDREKNWNALAQTLDVELPPLQQAPFDEQCQIPKACSTLDRLVFWVADHSQGIPFRRASSNFDASRCRSRTEDEVWQIVRESISKALGVELNAITQDSHMRDDLGIG